MSSVDRVRCLCSFVLPLIGCTVDLVPPPAGAAAGAAGASIGIAGGTTAGTGGVPAGFAGSSGTSAGSSPNEPTHAGGAPTAAGGATGSAGSDVASPAARGATLPYDEYEAESVPTTGVVLPASRRFGEVAAEASGRRAVRLEQPGQRIDFTLAHRANSVVVRYSIPDAPGAENRATLGVYGARARKASLQLTSRYSWTYGDEDAQGQASEQPSNGTPHRTSK